MNQNSSHRNLSKIKHMSIKRMKSMQWLPLEGEGINRLGRDMKELPELMVTLDYKTYAFVKT